MNTGCTDFIKLDGSLNSQAGNYHSFTDHFATVGRLVHVELVDMECCQWAKEARTDPRLETTILSTMGISISQKQIEIRSHTV